MSWRGALTLVLLVAAVVTGWSAWRQRADTRAAAAGAPRSDYVLRDLELVALDKQGKEAFTLRAPTLERDPADKTLSLRTPLFLIPDAEGRRWTLRSDTGWVSADNSEVRLRGNVLAHSPPDASPATLKTGQLNVFPDKELATSPDVVAVEAPGYTMRGTGMRAHLADGRIELLSRVQGTYEP